MDHRGYEQGKRRGVGGGWGGRDQSQQMQEDGEDSLPNFRAAPVQFAISSRRCPTQSPCTLHASSMRSPCHARTSMHSACPTSPPPLVSRILSSTHATYMKCCDPLVPAEAMAVLRGLRRRTGRDKGQGRAGWVWYGDGIWYEEDGYEDGYGTRDEGARVAGGRRAGMVD